MNLQKLALAALVGAVVSFALGGLIYVVLLGSFFTANVGSATNAFRDPPLYWAIGVSELAASCLLTLIVGAWAKATSAAGGAQLGAVFGLLAAIMFDFNIFGTTNVTNLTATLVDPLLFAIRFAIVGGVIGAMVARRP